MASYSVSYKNYLISETMSSATISTSSPQINIKRFPCSTCNKSLLSSSPLQIHMLTHTQTRNHTNVKNAMHSFTKKVFLFVMFSFFSSPTGRPHSGEGVATGFGVSSYHARCHPGQRPLKRLGSHLERDVLTSFRYLG